MAVHEIIPSTNVSMADIRDTLNANEGNVTNVLGSFFGDSAKINKWAKFKPVSYKGDFPANGVQWKGDANSTLWGLQVGIMNNAQSQKGPKDMYDSSSMPNYDYDRPKGGANSPYRLQDFCGYYTKATGIFIQSLAKDSVETIHVTNTATETKEFVFSVYCSTHNNAIKFSDIEEVARLDSTYKLRLVLSVYKKGTDTLIAEYVNNNTKMYDFTNYGGDSTYDKDDSKKVSVKFPKSVYWGASDSITEIDVYLSLQTVKIEVTPSGNYPHADKIIALPYSSDRYFKKSFKFSLSSRYIRATKIHKDSSGSTRIWVDITEANAFNYPGLGTPDVMFEVNKVPNESLTFQNGVCFLRSKHVKRDGGTTIASGTLTSESGANVQSSVNVPAGETGTINVYFKFGDMLGEPESYNGRPLLSGQYLCDIYLVRIANGIETEVKVDSVFLWINVPK